MQQLLRKLSVRYRLILLVSAGMALTLLMVGVSSLTTNALHQSVERLYQHRLQGLKSLKVISDSYGAEISQSIYLLKTGNLNLDNASNKVIKARRAAEQELAAYRQNNALFIQEHAEQHKLLFAQIEKTDSQLNRLWFMLRQQTTLPSELELMTQFNQISQEIDVAAELLSRLINLQIVAAELEHREDKTRYETTRLTVTILLVVGILVSAIFAVLVALSIGSPLQNLVQIMMRVRRSGDLSLRVKPQENDDIGRLGRVFDDMLANLQLRDNALRLSNQQLKETNDKLEQAQQQLVQSEKMASIGQLAAGVAHEINNPLGYVYSNMGALEHYLKDLLALIDQFEHTPVSNPSDLARLDQFKQEIDLDFLREDIGDLLSQSREGLSRVKKIVLGLKDFSRVDAQDVWTSADLNACLESTYNIIANEIRGRATVNLQLNPLPLVDCLPSQLNQVFLNLLVNAGQAMTEPGTITVTTHDQGEHVIIEVADTGQGIPEQVLGKIFDPFFTTKPVGQGTGLGLSISYGIVKKHHGKMSVQSTVGQGTTFRIELPVHQEQAQLSTAA